MKTKKPKTVQQLLNWIATLPAKGLIRTNPPSDAYPVGYGWLDKQETDSLLVEAQRHLADASTPLQVREQIMWTRSQLLWELGRFEEAKADILKTIETIKFPSYHEAAKRNLAQIEKRRLPKDIDL